MAAGVGALAIAVVLVTALVLEVTDGFDDEMVHSALKAFTQETKNSNTTQSLFLEVRMAAVFPAAMLVLTSERVMTRASDRKVNPRRLGQLTRQRCGGYCYVAVFRGCARDDRPQRQCPAPGHG